MTFIENFFEKINQAIKYNIFGRGSLFYDLLFSFNYKRSI